MFDVHRQERQEEGTMGVEENWRGFGGSGYEGGGGVHKSAD